MCVAEAVDQPKIRVVVADDHPIVRSGITAHLDSHRDIEVVGEAVDGDTALQLARRMRPDVVVLDINMPGRRTVDVVAELVAMPISTSVLILTAHNDLEHILALLKSGAKGYVLKDEEPSTIIAAVRSVAAGRTWVSPGVMATMVDHTVRDKADDDPSALSSRELEVLHLLSNGRDNQEIGRALNISERTVRYHLHNIYDKLGVQRRAEAIAWAVRRGLGES